MKTWTWAEGPNKPLIGYFFSEASYHRDLIYLFSTANGTTGGCTIMQNAKFMIIITIIQEKQREMKEICQKLEETERSLKETEDKFV